MNHTSFLKTLSSLLQSTNIAYLVDLHNGCVAEILATVMLSCQNAKISEECFWDLAESIS